MIKRIILPFVVLCSVLGLTLSQPTNGLVGHYTFDDCAVTDDTGNSPDGVITGNPDCRCGPVGNALFFDGQGDYVEFFSDYSDLLSKDFTASFYLSPQNVTGVIDIFSKREACTPDSAVAVRYEPQTRTLRCELTEGISERAEVKMTLPEGQCWYHITWIRSGGQLALFLDGELRAVEDFNQQIDARNFGTFSIANSPCLGNGEERYRGGMDEFRVYNRALSEEEVRQLYVPVDQLANQDTIIFQGASMQARLPNSCAPDYLWTPPTGVSDPTLPEPVLAPLETTTYGVLMDYGYCRAADTVRIIVVDSSELDCDDVFLPNAFTPNEDGLNDVYGMSNANFFLGDFVSLEIYDRWGSKLFESTDALVQWDGTINGQQALPGVYVYKLRYRCNDGQKVASGSFNLLR